MQQKTLIPIITSATVGTVYQEVEKITITDGKPTKTEWVKTVHINSADKWTLMFYVSLLLSIVAMSYGPLAAYLVEMFPLKIRYTALSFPYHIGFGVLGGMSLVVSNYLVNKATETHSETYYLAGLTYPNIIMSISFVIGLLYLKEYKDIESKPPSEWVNKIRRILGIVWILLALFAAYFDVAELGLPKIMSGKQDDLIFGIIIMCVITPLTAIGLFLFGKYAWQGEFDE